MFWLKILVSAGGCLGQRKHCLVAESLSADKPNYNSEITIKLQANGTYTYTFPAGTDLASFGGYYSLDEQLNISMVPIADTKTLTVTSLPNSQQYKAGHLDGDHGGTRGSPGLQALKRQFASCIRDKSAWGYYEVDSLSDAIHHSGQPM